MSSELAFINVKVKNPFKLYYEWEEEVKKYNKLSSFGCTVMCLATVNKNGKVSNRNVLVEEVLEDGFVFFTDKRSRKIQDIKENSNCAATILWSYDKEGKSHTYQVRIEGTTQEMSESESRKYYERKDIYCKIRSYVCNQDERIDWPNLKSKHDDIVKEVHSGNKELPMPSHQGAFKITPETIEFYYTYDNAIADRVLFEKDSSCNLNQWDFVHLAA